MPVAPAVGAAAITAGGSLVGGIGQGLLAGGGGGGGAPVKLPPELEAQQLQIIQSQIQQAQAESQKAGDLSNMMYQRANVLNQVSQGYIPYSEGANAITRLNQSIAEKYGAETLNVLGLAQEIRGQAQDLLNKPLAEFTDPAVERQLAEAKKVMNEQMSRDLGPNWQQTEAGQRALATFNESAAVARSGASREMRAEQLNQLTNMTSIGNTLGQGVFQGAGFGQSALSSNLAAYQGMMQEAATTGVDIGGKGLEMSQIPFRTLQQFGQQNLSKDITRFVEGGAGGMFPNFQTYAEAGKPNSYLGSGGRDYYSNYQWSK